MFHTVCSPLKNDLQDNLSFEKTCLSDDHIHRLLETFEEIDTDKTGTITDEGKDLHNLYLVSLEMIFQALHFELFRSRN